MTAKAAFGWIGVTALVAGIGIWGVTWGSWTSDRTDILYTTRMLAAAVMMMGGFAVLVCVIGFAESYHMIRRTIKCWWTTPVVYYHEPSPRILRIMATPSRLQPMAREANRLALLRTLSDSEL